MKFETQIVVSIQAFGYCQCQILPVQTKPASEQRHPKQECDRHLLLPWGFVHQTSLSEYVRALHHRSLYELRPMVLEQRHQSSAGPWSAQ
jgi:hypothetical protein